VSSAGLSLLEESADELYEHAPCGYLSALTDGTIVRVNQTLLDWTGYTRDRLVGRKFRDLLPVAGRVFYETHYDPLLRMQGFVREMALELVCESGRLLPVLINSVLQKDPAGEAKLVRTSLADITERRVYEGELLSARKRAEQLALVVESSADAIFLTSPQGVVLTWNRGAQNLFGYTADEAVGRAVQQLIVPPEYATQAERARLMVQAGQQVQLETVRAHKNGTRLDVSLGLTPHIEPPGELIAISAIIRDITERRLVESRLRQSEQLQSVATLAGGVAHEVNNQMAVVLGFAELVLRALGSGHPQTEDMQRILSAAGKAAGISRQLLAFSQQLPIVRQNVNLVELVHQAAPALRQLLGPDNSLEIITPPEARAHVDPIQIEQVLAQLATNARDFMDPGGRLEITIRSVELSEQNVETHLGDEVIPGAYHLLKVSDTGAGMDEVTLRRAFEPFFTTKSFGTGNGLGLATVHGIVKQHGGHLWASSRLGEGTTIRVYLPADSSAIPV
jgi:PAS domain S-box-containing protein